MYHVVAFTSNAFNNPAYDANPVADNWMGITNGHYFPQRDLRLFGGYLGGANLNRATLVTPQTRRVVPPILSPINRAANPVHRPSIWDRRRNPTTLKAVEEICVYFNCGGSAAATTVAVLFVGDSLDQAPAGDVYTLHGTSTTAAIPLRWTQLDVQWEITLPAGVYTVVSTQLCSVGAVAHRVNFRDPTLRPGFLSITDLGNLTDETYLRSGWGALGHFNTQAYPFIEVLCTSADVNHDIILFMVKTG